MVFFVDLTEPSLHALSSRCPLPDDIGGDLRSLLEFIIETDRLKTVVRKSPLAADDRLENDAEHSWHLALMVILLSEYSDEGVDVRRCLELVVVHDLVEIYAGDTPLYDEVGRATQDARELASADRLFAALPQDVGLRMRALWDEFEARVTPEARFAKAMDRLQPTLLNWMAGGGTWQSPGVTTNQIRERKSVIGDASGPLWEAALKMIAEGARRGWSREL